jgi:hypothetical protein
MAIFEQAGFRLPGALPPTSRRAEAEAYAASLGMTRGTPGWGDAIRDFVMNQASVSARPSGPPMLPQALAPVRDPGAEFPLGIATFDRGVFPGPSGVDPADAQFSDPASGTIPPHPVRLVAAAGEGGPTHQRWAGSAGRAQSRPAPAPAPPPRDPSPRERRAVEALITPLYPKNGASGDGLVTGTRLWDVPRDRRPRNLPNGSLAEIRETRGGGVGTISRGGPGDRGGRSFGSFQLSTNSDMARAFADSVHALAWRHELGGLSPKDRLFQQRWKAISARDPAAFREAQQLFVADELYYDTIQKTWDASGVDLDARSETVREAIWSASLQHRDAHSFLPRAIAAADRRLRDRSGRVDRSSPAYDQALIEEIYPARMDYVRNLRNRTPKERRTDQNIIPQLAREMQTALRMFAEERRAQRRTR